MRIVVSTTWDSVAAEVADPETAGLLDTAFATMLAASDGPPVSVMVRPGQHDTVVLTTHGHRAMVVRTGAEAALAVSTEFNRILLGSCPHLAIHAAVLLTPCGAVALPAESGTGKSTLAAACMQLGAAYVSDEALVLDGSGAVIPYPRPLGLSRWSRSTLGVLPVGQAAKDEVAGEALVDPRGLGRVAHPDARPHLCAIVSLDRVAAARPSLESLPRSEAVVQLLRHSFNHYREPAGSVELATRVARGAEVMALRGGDPIETARLLVEHFTATGASSRGPGGSVGLGGDRTEVVLEGAAAVEEA